MADPVSTPASVAEANGLTVVQPGDTNQQPLSFGPAPAPLPEDQYDPKRMSIGETYGLVAQEDHLVPAIMRLHAMAGMPADPNDPGMPEMDSPEFKVLTDGIPEEQWEPLYNARSQQQRAYLANEIREENAVEARLAQHGAWGIPGRLLIDASDPLGFALGVATGGIGVASKAARMARTAATLEKAGKIADAAAMLEKVSPLTKAASATKIALQRGAVDAGVNAALTEVTNAGTPTRDQWDVVHSAMLGFGMGAGLSRVFAGSELHSIRTGIENTRAKVSAAELSDYIDQRKAEIVNAAENSPTATTLKQAQDDLEATQKAVASDAGNLSPAEQAAVPARLEAAHAAVAQAQKAHDAALAKHEADLAKLTQMQKAGASGLKNMDSADAADAAGAFGEDSGGAARFMGVYESVNPEHEYPSGLPMSQQAMSRAGRAIGTISSILRGNKNEVVRAELGPLVGDTIGTVDGSTSSFGASEIAKRLSKSYTTKFNQAVTDAYDAWAKRTGVSLREKWTRPVRDKFMSDVGLHIRGQLSQDADVARAGESIRALFKKWDQEAHEAGVPGFEELHSNDNFLPRVFDFNALERIEHEIGTPNVKLLVQKGIQEAMPELEEKIAARMAHFYVKRMKELRVGSDVGLMNGMRFDDIGFLRKFLEEAGGSKAEIDDIADKFAQLKKSQHRDKGGDFRNAKHRTTFDENFGMDFRRADDRDGSKPTVHVKISDLLENNVEALYGRYQRAMAGHIGLAKVGIKSQADFAARLSRVEGALEGDLKELGKVKDVANLVYKLITGQPVEDANMATKWGRLIRDWNYATTMNQAGFSQTPDWAGLLAKGYLGYTLKFLPEVAGVVKRARNGHLGNEEADMLQSWLGVGTDNYNNSVFSAYDDPLSHEGFEGAIGKLEHGLRVAGRITTKISGLGFANDVATRMAAKAVLHRLADEARRGGVISSKRLAQIGLDQKMMERIRTQINGTTENVDADFVGKARILNFAKWTDVEARDAMLNGIFREARRLIQEEDLGETNKWIHGTLGKMIMQFRRFMLVSYTKQILHGANMRDAETASTFMVGTALAGLSYTTQFGIKAASIQDPDERQKFMDKYLTPKAIALASWSRGNYSSFFPAAMDSITGTLLGIRNFDNRASQLGSGLLDGNPTLTLANSFGVAAGSLVQPLLRGDKQFTQSDAAAWRHLLPFQNFIGMDILFNALTKDLPKKSKDPNPNHTDWMWQ